MVSFSYNSVLTIADREKFLYSVFILFCTHWKWEHEKRRIARMGRIYIFLYISVEISTLYGVRFINSYQFPIWSLNYDFLYGELIEIKSIKSVDPNIEICGTPADSWTYCILNEFVSLHALKIYIHQISSCFLWNTCWSWRSFIELTARILWFSFWLIGHNSCSPSSLSVISSKDHDGSVARTMKCPIK